VDRLEESSAWEDMEDYQFGWYVKLLVKTTRSARLGYLRLDRDKLWLLAGARSKQFFEKNNAVVMARFKTRQFGDGQDWIYNSTMLSVLEEQSQKYRLKKPPRESASISPLNLSTEKSKTKEEPRQQFKEDCEHCHGTGKRVMRSHPGRFVECWCYKAE
jgi:hypothetical protein